MSRGELDLWKGAFDEMYRFTVIPRRSVDRIRRALADGQDPEPYLEDIEKCLQACVDLANQMDDRPPACPTCMGLGHVPRVDSAENRGQERS